MTKTVHSRGFTLLELVISITVVSVLLAIAVPAVMAARERSRQAQCRDRLRACGVALQHRESVQRRLPPALWSGSFVPAPTGASTHQLSPHVQLLPYLDQLPVSQRIADLPVLQPQWDPRSMPPPANTVIAAFVCPSDARDGGTNYCAATGPWASAFDIDGVEQSGHGAFSDLAGHRLQDFRDGLSQTIGFSERVQSDDDPSEFGGADYWGSNAAEFLNDTRDSETMIAICASLTSTPAGYYPWVGHSWLIAGYDHTWYNHAVTPNARIPDCTANDVPPLAIISGASSSYPPSTFGVHKAASRHPGGVNVVYLDGHVSFVSDSIDRTLWRGLATRDGQEVVDSPGM